MTVRAPHQVTLEALLALQADARGLDLSSRKRVLTDMAGTHLSGFRGRGMEFEEHRIYEPGDDVRAIDWRVTARTGQPHIKRFREERERPVYLVTDLAPSMFFATRGVFKSVLAAEAAAVLGWAAVANRDRVGGIIATGDELIEVRPASGRRGLLRYCNQLVKAHAAGAAPGSSTLQDGLRHVQRLARGGAVVIVISDFQSLPESAAPLLQKIASRCELVLSMVSDPFERELPAKAGLPVTSAAAADGRRWFLKSKQSAGQQWAAHFQSRLAFWHKQLLPFGARWLALDTAMPLREQLWHGLGHRHKAQVAEEL
jgi:uncharacterized protein (DUF58 family)